MQLCEKYRPTTLDGVIGQEDVCKRIKAVLSRDGFDRDAWFIHGKSGTGKTSIAKIVADMLGAGVVEVDGTDCTVDAVREITKDMPWNVFDSKTGWRVWIVNEAHHMTDRAIPAWLTLLEKLPAKRLVIFTSIEPLFKTKQECLFGVESIPFKGRVKVFKLTEKIGAAKVAVWLKEVAMAEGMDGKPLDAYERKFNECRGSIRDCLQEIEQGTMLA